MDDITHLTESLFADTPKGLLYHYTTLSGLLGIVNSRTLWASDIRYMNDSAELKHAADLIRGQVHERISRKQGRPDLLGRFVDWVSHRITNGHLLFGSSFRSHGNLLSQWRGYSPHGKGVSLGFSSEYILECADSQGFQIGKCIYEPARQKRLIERVLDALESQVEERLTGQESRERLHAVYADVFDFIETDLLRLAAILKHPSFREEKEWRIVSPVYTSYDDCTILFREANAVLVPYIEFDLAPVRQTPKLEHVFVGPSPNSNISINSVRMFLAQRGIDPARGIDYCQIPYRLR
ncbi:DUF2971 domain-containing protein [Desulfofustis glycolicus]|uniref:DUF2971 domain-containing protein n=1 Tax=Desulfofustis glycolicus DSM 9705 TaxID=1121409 RepID=A0A1M5YR83_9BACT|nr:DUF2971 domain-containing protein [Desulfofustis glycolicus]MCB2215835.1 DUF2971 domain-containing protein [Desulfobulbaceae bacterium]SHI14389.1 Protein of unknown function [Desulfofustis glycolicus DSM 9705]